MGRDVFPPAGDGPQSLIWVNFSRQCCLVQHAAALLRASVRVPLEGSSPGMVSVGTMAWGGSGRAPAVAACAERSSWCSYCFGTVCVLPHKTTVREICGVAEALSREGRRWFCWLLPRAPAQQHGPYPRRCRLSVPRLPGGNWGKEMVPVHPAL